jgi:hypothetical protein
MEERKGSAMRARDKKRRKTLRAAHRAPDWVRFVAASKAGLLADQRRHRNAKWGKSFGAASPVRQIVKDGKPTAEFADAAVEEFTGAPGYRMQRTIIDGVASEWEPY